MTNLVLSNEGFLLSSPENAELESVDLLIPVGKILDLRRIGVIPNPAEIREERKCKYTR